MYIYKQNSIRLVLASTYLNNTQLTFFKSDVLRYL